jgi:ATP-dependent exoDNAse (exonuclease V) beta subunit
MLIGQLKPTHSFYLKYYYLLLKSEQISQYSYDICMLDEAQDTNEVTLGIFECLSAKTKIFVGDEHQQIYSFRGSKNALSKIKSDIKLYLSQSFRFNNSVASFANILLQNFKNEKVAIEAKSEEDKKIMSNGYISRTNAQLIAIISQRIESKKPFVTVRDPNEIFNLTIEVHYFLNGTIEDIKRNRFLKRFKTEDDLLDYAKEVEDYELKSALKIAKEYDKKIFDFKDIADKFYKAWQNRVNNGFEQRIEEILFLTTAHTAKGLEWDRVVVADDFNDFADLILDFGCESLEQFQKEQEHLPNGELIDEFNLFYVAITRAKKELIKESENFHYLMAKDIGKLLDTRIKEAKSNLESIESSKPKKASKLTVEEKQVSRQQKNIEEGKAKNSGLKWSLEDRIKAKSMYNKDHTILQIASKLERTTGSILGELFKSEGITKQKQINLAQILKSDPPMAKKSVA